MNPPNEPKRLYERRQAQALEPHYSAHVSAMTTEGLHAKAAIAAELAWRDAQITRIRLHHDEAMAKLRAEHAALDAEACHLRERLDTPIPMVLPCPRCDQRHVDAPEPETGWKNPPHKSHLCATCGCVWRPAAVPTTGVASILTRGKADTWPIRPEDTVGALESFHAAAPDAFADLDEVGARIGRDLMPRRSEPEGPSEAELSAAGCYSCGPGVPQETTDANGRGVCVSCAHNGAYDNAPETDEDHEEP